MSWAFSLGLAIVLSAAGCHSLASEFHCDAARPCALGGKTGTCESTGYCTFTDASCATGRRYDVSAGMYAEACYGTEVGGDGALAIVAGLSGGRGAHADRGALARLGGPQGFAWDGTLLYVSDSYYGVIWTLDLDGTLTRLAGSTVSGGLTDGSYDVAMFGRPNGMVLIGRTLYVADSINAAVRAIDLDAKQVTTVAILPPSGGEAYPWGITTDGTELFVTDQTAKGIWRLNPSSGELKPLAAGFVKPTGIVFSNGELFVADNGEHTVSRVSLPGVKTKVAGIPGSPGTTTGTTSGRFSSPGGVAIGADGKLLVADYYGFRVRAVDLGTGEITNFAGTGVNGSNDGPTSQAKVRSPVGVIAVGSTVYIGEESAVRKVADGMTTTVAGAATRAGDDDGTPDVATLDRPEAVAVGADGTIYVADTANRSVRVIAPDTRVVSTRVTGFEQPRAIALAGDQLYVGDAGDHTVKRYDLGTSILSTLTSTCDGMMIQRPLGLAVDTTANRLYFTDEGWNHVCGTDLATGDTVVVAGTGTAGVMDGPLLQARFLEPHGLAISGQVLYVSETRTGTIRRIDLVGNTVTRIAGDSYKREILAGPVGLAVDGDGRLLIAEAEGQRILRIDTLGGPLVPVLGTQGDAVMRVSEPSLVNRPTGLAWSPLLGLIGTSTAENLVFRIR